MLEKQTFYHNMLREQIIIWAIWLFYMPTATQFFIYAKSIIVEDFVSLDLMLFISYIVDMQQKHRRTTKTKQKNCS